MNVLIKPVSGSCNMTCGYCFYRDEAENRHVADYGRMDERTLKNLVRKFVLASEGSCTFAFQGGEPTLWGLERFQKTVEYVEHYNRGRIPVQYSLQTNGIALDEAWCRFLKENHFLVGVSVDGTRKQHDLYRCRKDGTGSYDLVLKKIELLHRYGVEYNILTVVHGLNVHAAEEIYEDYKRRGWRYLQFIACLDPLEGTKGGQEYSLYPEEYGKFLTKLFELWYADWEMGRQPYIRQFENYIGILSGFRPDSCEQDCECGILHVAEADGSIYPCDFYALDAYYLGNINKVQVLDLQRRREELDFVGRSLAHSKECKSCSWFSLCRGGCYRNRVDGGKNYFCRAYQMLFEAGYERMCEIAEHISGFLK